MSNKLRMILDNLHDTATLTASTEGMPIEYTQRSGRSYVWRSEFQPVVDLPEQTIEATLAKPAYLDAVVIYAHNISTAGTVRVELMLSGSVVYDSGAVVATEIIPLGIWRAGIDPWGASALTGLPIRQYTSWIDPVVADAYRITINDPANPDDYLEIGRIFAGVTFSPELNPQYGVSLDWLDFTELQRTESGSLRAVGEGSARRLSIDLAHLSREGISENTRQLLTAGKRRDIYVSMYPEQGGMLENEHAFVARRGGDYTHTHSAYNQWQAPIQFDEV
ncbi:hypothetical protein [Halomonas organivorans]|uniref:Uncharacterized protein n=1 Tax=Halomonas organivorans TaxID=257772 RepID=A0A7W5C1D4_9GAMM|nr:hypothetical protein [Halomonas organivorans]MBB3142837.1 hypothetical protein [Halomonas organivorans]